MLFLQSGYTNIQNIFQFLKRKQTLNQLLTYYKTFILAHAIFGKFCFLNFTVLHFNDKHILDGYFCNGENTANLKKQKNPTKCYSVCELMEVKQKAHGPHSSLEKTVQIN